MLRILRASIRAPVRVPARYMSAKESPDKDILYVDLNDSADTESLASTKQFFEYQTGRWLQNDRAEREARTTKFSLKGLLDLLKREVDYLDKNPLAIETIEPFFEGKHNKIYKVQLKDLRTYVLRIPYALGSPEYRRLRLLSEVATADFLAARVFADSDEPKVKIPSAIAYSGTADNELGVPFILSSFVAGEKLSAQWKPWSIDVEEKKPVIEPAAAIAGRILKHKFPAFGSLYHARDMPDGIPVDDSGFVIGPTTEKRFWKSETSAPFRGPWHSWREYLQATADLQLAEARALPDAESMPNLKAAERYAQLVPALFADEELPGELASARLFDPDLSPMNVIAQDDVLWLIDFENSVVKPYFLHGVPWFVRNPGERIYSLEEIPEFDSLPEQDRRVLTHFHSLTQTEFTYEMLLRDAVPDLIMAHHPSIKRREEVVHRAMQTDIASPFFNDLDFVLFRLGELWKMLGIQRDFPLTYSEADTDALAASIGAWNQQLMRNKYLESKGFVPADEFDKLLGTGALEPVDDTVGNYEFRKEFLDSQDPLKVE